MLIFRAVKISVHSPRSDFLLHECSLRGFLMHEICHPPHMSLPSVVSKVSGVWGVSFPRILQPWLLTVFHNCATSPVPILPPWSLSVVQVSASAEVSLWSLDQGVYFPWSLWTTWFELPQVVTHLNTSQDSHPISGFSPTVSIFMHSLLFYVNFMTR